MIYSIHQPNYMPWLGLFHKIYYSDIFVVIDNAQVDRKTLNKNKIRTPNGWCWISVPLIKRGRLYQKIFEVKPNNELPWKEKTKKTIFHNYKRADYFDDHWPFFEDLFSKEWDVIKELNMHIIEHFLDVLDIKREIVYGTDLKVEGNKNELLINICKKIGASVYLSGTGAVDYNDPKILKDNGIELIYQDFIHPVYKQNFPGFEANMSIIDLVFNHGPRSKEILLSTSDPS